MMNHIIETGQSLLSSPYPTTFSLPFHPIRPLSAHYKPYKEAQQLSLTEGVLFFYVEIIPHSNSFNYYSTYYQLGGRVLRRHP